MAPVSVPSLQEERSADGGVGVEKKGLAKRGGSGRGCGSGKLGDAPPGTPDTSGTPDTATAAIDTTKTVALTDLIVAVEGPVDGGHCHIGCARQAARGARIRSGAQAPTDGLMT